MAKPRKLQKSLKQNEFYSVYPDSNGRVKVHPDDI